MILSVKQCTVFDGIRLMKRYILAGCLLLASQRSMAQQDQESVVGNWWIYVPEYELLLYCQLEQDGTAYSFLSVGQEESFRTGEYVYKNDSIEITMGDTAVWFFVSRNPDCLCGDGLALKRTAINTVEELQKEVYRERLRSNSCIIREE